MDDFSAIFEKNNRDLIVDTFNNFDPYLKFTIELENNNKINFLDIQIERCNDNTIRTKWYRKSIASGRYINFFSHHPTSQKIATVYSLVDKAITISHPSFHRNNLILVENLLLKNMYPPLCN